MLFYQRIEPGPEGPPAHVEAGPARDEHALLEPRLSAPAASHDAFADIATTSAAPFVEAGDDTKQ